MYLAVLKTRPHKYLTWYFPWQVSEHLFPSWLADWVLFPFVNFSIMFIRYLQKHTLMHKQTHTYKNTIRHQASHIAKENWSEIFAFPLCSNITWNPASHIRIGYICEINLKFTRFNLLASTSAMAPSKFISPSLGFNFILRSFSWVYFGPFH